MIPLFPSLNYNWYKILVSGVQHDILLLQLDLKTYFKLFLNWRKMWLIKIPSLFSGKYLYFENYDNLLIFWIFLKTLMTCVSLISMLENWFWFVYQHIRRIIQLRFEIQQIRDLVQNLLLYCKFKNSSAIDGTLFNVTKLLRILTLMQRDLLNIYFKIQPLML